jgi:uncharacterized membrane protein YhaH (DUF805 family)
MLLPTKREGALAHLISSYRHNLGNLIRFSGRDTNAQFWPWAISVFLAAFGASFVTMAAALAEATIMTMRGAQGEVPMANAGRLVTDLGWLWKPLALSATAAVILLGASVTRRLHDIGWRGFWGLAPLPFLALGIAYTPEGFRHAAAVPGPPPPIGAIVSPPLFYITLIVLIVILTREGKIESNRFGPPAAD